MLFRSGMSETLKVIADNLKERMSTHIDSRCATADEVSLAWLVCEVQHLEAENARLREALAFLLRETSVTYKYVTSAGHGGVTPLLSDAIDKAKIVLGGTQ